jgi:hypothetical protein
VSEFQWGDVRAFVEQDVIMPKSVTEQGHPEELTEEAAERLGQWLVERARDLWK